MHIEDDKGHVERFDPSFYLQCYAREAWHTAFEECGYAVVAEYNDRESASWKRGSDECIFEAVELTGP